MRSEVFTRLIEQIHALGDEALPPATDELPRALDRGHELIDDTLALAPNDLHQAASTLLAALADRVETELSRVLALSWDQIDSLVLMDATLVAEARRLRAAARALTNSDGEPERAAGLACALMLDASIGLATMIERRLAALVRLRGKAPLLVDGRPFIDLAPALREAARAWS